MTVRPQCYVEFLRTTPRARLYASEIRMLNRDAEWCAQNPEERQALEALLLEHASYKDNPVLIVERWLEYLIVYDLTESLFKCVQPDHLKSPIRKSSKRA